MTLLTQHPQRLFRTQYLRLEFPDDAAYSAFVDDLSESIAAKLAMQLPTPFPSQSEEEPTPFKQVCKKLGICEATGHAKKRTGELPFHKIGGRVYGYMSEIRAKMKPIHSVIRSRKTKNR